MNAFDIFNINPEITDSLIISSFNVMSNRSSNYALPDATGYVRSEYAGEKPNDWKKRFELSIDIILKKQFDICCLQEVTPEFYKLLPDRYHQIYDEKQNLLILVNRYTIQQIPIRLSVTKTKFSKALGCVVTINGKNITIVNVHLSGDPDKTNERIDLLKEFAGINTIVIGDFNQSVSDLVQDYDFVKFLDSKDLKLDNQGIDVMTAYSRYVIDNMGYVIKVKEDAWSSVDHIIYDSNRFFLISKEVIPKEGINGLEVPYLKVGDKWTRNFITWISDHTWNEYTFLIYTVTSR